MNETLLMFYYTFIEKKKSVVFQNGTVVDIYDSDDSDVRNERNERNERNIDIATTILKNSPPTTTPIKVMVEKRFGFIHFGDPAVCNIDIDPTVEDAYESRMYDIEDCIVYAVIDGDEIVLIK
tara:strand:+ start:66915 stop:67283 length:369 start_codon:yes stop_codon:yes gene_type:complete